MPKSLIRHLANSAVQPRIPLAVSQRSKVLTFDLGIGKQSRDAMMRAYSTSGTVYAIVNLLQQAAASPPWRLYKKAPPDGRRRYTTADRGSDQRREIIAHAALSLWNKPNAYHTGFEFREGANQHLELTGETFWVLDRESASFPTSMWYVNPSSMEPVPGDTTFLAGWIYHGPSGEMIPLRADEVILERMPDPNDPFRGAGPVGAIMPNIQQQRYATEYQRNLFLNGAEPAGLIQIDRRLSEGELDEMVDRWREQHRGVARAGRVGVLENGATWVDRKITNRDMEYTNLRLTNRDEIREAWRIHKHMLGTVDDVNRANAQTAEETFTGWSTVPRLNRRRDTLNFKLLPMFGDDGIEFDYDDPMPLNHSDDVEELNVKSTAAKALVGVGFDPEDVLYAVGLPAMKFTGVAAANTPSLPSEAIPVQPVIGARAEIRNDAATKAFGAEADCYPPGAVAWMHHAEWKGPVKVPLAHIDPDMSAMDTADPAHVDDFVKEIQAGHKVKPVILVKRPSKSMLLLVDGHHRYLAWKQLGKPVRAFIATVATDSGPWLTMHKQQIDQPANKLGDLMLRALEPADDLGEHMAHYLNGWREKAHA